MEQEMVRDSDKEDSLRSIVECRREASSAEA